MARGGMNDFMGQAQRIQAKLAEVQQGLRDKTVEGVSGGGMIRVQMSGHHEVLRVRIDPSAVDSADLELLEDLLVAAVSDARVKADEMAQQEMARAAQELGLPPALAQQLLGGQG